MKEIFKKRFSTDLGDSLLATLTRYFPPKEFNEALIDIVNVLMDALSRGIIYIDMGELPKNIDLQYEGWPKLHKKVLIASGWTTGVSSPIVLEGDLISWRRTHNEMVSTIKKIDSRNKLINPISKEVKIRTYSDTLNHQQKKAVTLVDSHNIILLSGGPGTGKTSTILQMLMHALTQNPDLNVALAAPTGKAAKKLKDTIQSGIELLEVPLKNKLSKIPCKTLHKWLEAGPNGFKRNSKRLLNIDLVVVDEMSMVDLSIITGLLDALPKSCQMILVGDPDQLLPVSSGGIWQMLQGKKTNNNFRSNSVKLIKSYRNKGDIALLRNTLKEDGLDAFWLKLSTIDKSSNVFRKISSQKGIPDLLISSLLKHKNELKKFTKNSITSIPEEAWKSSLIEVNPSEEILTLFNFIDNLLVLCPKKFGPWGVQKIHQVLLGDNFENHLQNWEEGTPIMSRSNQPEPGLANGDVGVIIGTGDKRRFLFNVFSEKQKLVTRLVNPSRLNMFDAAYAMTIHKSQGSEADQVFLLWPSTSRISEENNLKKFNSDDYEKRMLYTAITRAKKQLMVITNKEEDF